jgi:pilus assembly protein FimV
LIAKSHRWQKTAVAAAAIALFGLTTTGAFALSLGRITVQSSLGEPLRAEIDVPDINAEEAASLQANVAAPAAFAAAGLDYNAAMSGLQVTLMRRPDGRAYIRLTSDRSINEPFVDMILEATWSSGRIVRDYTMLFDPPAMRQAPFVPTLPQVSGSVPAPVAAPRVPATASSNADLPRPATTARPAKPATAVSTPAPMTAIDGNSGQKVTVKDGDTAGRIASRTKASGVSLDQMLVALMRSNPDAFINGNLDRIRSGAVLNLPSAEQAQSVAPKEASQMVIAQSKDFNDFRRNLASNAPKTDVTRADRKASGAVEAKVEDKKPTTATPDKLTLSKGSVQGKAEDAKIAKERADKEAAARAAEIAKNIADLAKLNAASAPKTTPAAPAPAATPAASAPQPAPTPAVTVATAPAVAPAASAPAAPPAAPASAASAPAKPKPAVAPAPMPEEPPSLLDELLGDPMVPAAGGGLLALLGGFAFYRMRQRKKNAARVDSSFLESRLQPDSFFGASGGQRVDTGNDAPGSASSMVYSTSQLDAADDVDPVAEADVYLAYGRDLQAEEILKEAVRHNPGRLAIHTKLLEIFAKRRDTAGFQTSAEQAFKLTGADNPEWNRICELGLGIDPENPLYQPGGASPSAFVSLAPTPSSDEVPTSAFGSTVVQAANAEMAAAQGNIDLDLDLDFSADDEPASAISDVTGGTVAGNEQTVKMEAPALDVNSPLDFDISGPGDLSPEPPASLDLPEISGAPDGLNLPDSDDFKLPDFQPTGTFAAEPLAPAAEPVPSQDKSGMLEFDLGSLSLDLDPPAGAESVSGAPSTTGEDPLETKLALAEEFVSIGDDDGARALIEEVISEATGELRAKAQKALANLS